MIATAFICFFLLTVLLLGLAAYFGIRARRRIHLPLVALTLTSLVVTIMFAKELGTLYDLEAAGWITPVHLTIARVAAACYLLPLGTGLATLRSAQMRPWHRRAAIVAASLTVLAAATGVAMIVMAEPLE